MLLLYIFETKEYKFSHKFSSNRKWFNVKKKLLFC